MLSHSFLLEALQSGAAIVGQSGTASLSSSSRIFLSPGLPTAARAAVQDAASRWRSIPPAQKDLCEALGNQDL